MKLIVGFGNPETRYNFTRHNFGFLALDFYAKTHQLNWEKSAKMGALWLKARLGREDVILIKPQTYYNEVGQSIAAFARFYKIPLDKILIICDDFTLEFGKIRFREKGSDGGNNGLKSAILHLKTTDFARLRLGTANDALRAKIGDTDFVLSKFTPDEKAALPQILQNTSTRIDEFLG